MGTAEIQRFSSLFWISSMARHGQAVTERAVLAVSQRQWNHRMLIELRLTQSVIIWWWLEWRDDEWSGCWMTEVATPSAVLCWTQPHGSEVKVPIPSPTAQRSLKFQMPDTVLPYPRRREENWFLPSPANGIRRKKKKKQKSRQKKH